MDNDNKVSGETSQTPDSPAKDVQSKPADQGSSDVPGLSAKSTILSDQVFKTKKPHHLIFSMVVLVIVLILIIWGVGYLINHKSNTTVSNNGGITDIWTGKGNGVNWTDPKNWSKGLPKNTDSIEFDLSSISNYGKGEFINDIAGSPSYNEFIITGTAPSSSNIQAPEIIGNKFSLSNGIIDESTSSAFNFYNPVNLSGDQTISIVNGTGSLNLNSPNTSGQAVSDDFGSGIITVKASGSSVILLGSVSGAATVMVDDSSPTGNGAIDFLGINYGYTGTIVVKSGLLSTSTAGLGSNPVTIDSGGAVGIFESATAPYTIDNNITMSGNGLAASTSNTLDESSGAIYVCDSNSATVCTNPISVNFSGKVTLTGNTQLGIYPNQNAPTGSTVTYTFSQPVSGKYNLTTVTGSNASVVD